ncbi:flagellar biosynthetic protein FliP [Desulfosalsimonas propionicica]|uniref:Flagellar biosynthetic protein FliP n=1 Tax=Desulfosalsimonas propionicica TaxID=332175 RepID=A0A7W0HKK2_9BACT|nr:flagellar type III secretion system pore protein FliP [Desulfosalsimonas propionicica]MBA2881312.1 flagellar biosynthetic protein FliP [Desulfosalsimonas propionicica]
MKGAHWVRIGLAVAAIWLCAAGNAAAQEPAALTLQMDGGGGTGQISTVIQIMVLLTVLSMAPAILLMTTSFIRIVVVLSFLRQAMGTQQMPPNQIIIGLAMFLTLFIMAPVFTQINEEALQPYLQEEIEGRRALETAAIPMREFMFGQVREADLVLMRQISGNEQVPETREDISIITLIPAFMLSELKRAFQIGFMIFVPFLVIDMITASVLMTMGMLMLPPIIISLPFKVLLFVLVDGWNLVVGSLVQGFY